MKTILPVVVGVGLALAGAGAAARAQESAQKKVKLAIQSETLADALAAWAEQTDYQVISAVEETTVLSAPRIQGRLTPQAALDRLLANTSLTYAWLNDRTVAIRERVLATEVSAAGQAGATASVQQLQQQRGEEILATNDSSSDKQASALSRGGTPRESGNGVEELEEVVVTGTHIRGDTATASPLTLITRKDIERSGRATLQDLVTTLPQNFGGGPTPSTAGVALDADSLANQSYGAGINLRGLGADATLVLINGHRSALSGYGGVFTDISSVPLNAVERIEILTDGASALYGSDAVAGVVNIIMRPEFEGADTQLRYGMTTSGSSAETQAGQLYGWRWDGGSALASYEYYSRDNLLGRNRQFFTADLHRYGGGDYRVTTSNPGNILDPNTFLPVYAIPRGQDGSALTPDDLVPDVANLEDPIRLQDVVPQQTRHAAFLSINQSLSDTTDVYGDIRWGRRRFTAHLIPEMTTLTVPDTNPFFVDPFGGSTSISVQYSFADDLGPRVTNGKIDTYSGTLGTRFAISNAWAADVYANFNRETTVTDVTNVVNAPALDEALQDPSSLTAFNPFGDGSHTSAATLDRIRGFAHYDDEFSLWSIYAKADGPIASVSGGQIKVAFGSEFRREKYTNDDVAYLATPVPERQPSNANDRDLYALFGELHIPFVSSINAVPGVRRLEMSLAGRFEHYSDFGDTTNPKIGVLWAPSNGVNLRATYGESFKAPQFNDLRQNDQLYFVFPLEDPSSPSGFTNALVLRGNKSDLTPEKSRSWTAGFDLSLPTAPNLSLSATYFDVRFRDRIIDPSDGLLQVFVEESTFASLIRRNPDIEAVNAVYSDPNFVDFLGIPASDVQAIVDAQTQNLAVTRTSGIDFHVAYDLGLPLGDFTISADATYLLRNEQGITSTSPRRDILDTLNNTNSRRGRLGLSWAKGTISASAFVSYVGSYENNVIDPVRPVSSWTTTDLQVGYRTESGEGLFGGLTVSLAAQNVFDKAPPFVENFNSFFAVGYDPANADAMGRFLSLTVRKQW